MATKLKQNKIITVQELEEEIKKTCKIVYKKAWQRFDEIFSTHPQLREVPEKTEIRTKQCNEGCEYSVWFDGEQIAKFTTSSKAKSYTETLVKISEITYLK